MERAILCGLSSLVRPDELVAARGLWRVPGPSRLFHADAAETPEAARPWLREVAEEFARRTDLTVLSGADTAALYGPVPPLRPARRLRSMGDGAVLLVCGPQTSILICDDADARPRADGPVDVVIGLPFTPALPNLQAALGANGVPWDAAGWLDLVNTAYAA